MPRQNIYTECSYRIALVMDLSSSVGHRMMSALCRRAMAYPNLEVRRYFVETLAEEGIDPLVDWQPDALVVFFGDTPLLKKLRKTLPKTPFISMNTITTDLVDAVITGNITETTDLALNHFFRNGLTHFALFFPGGKKSAENLANICHQLLHDHPGTFSNFHRYVDMEDLMQAPKDEALEQIGAWLQRLPKPVGIYSPTSHSSAYLLRICSHFGLAIPEEIQVIGGDGLEELLETLPHLTSIHVPAERIGATALKTAINLLRGKKPESKIQQVNGSSLIPQGSTGVIPSQLSDIATATAYIESHATQGATVDEVMNQTQSVSRMTFYREFKRETGDSPARYIRRIRIEAACQLLSTTQLDITQIAELAGFSGSNYFAQVFRRDIGMTPKQYRKSR
ncbi:MAG: helix-turn-helix domain-containing protein [Verrucomicrobia bacterium]|nr:helix-turn-helix domain-containing protein [Verrucomicrobiota bacterium]